MLPPAAQASTVGGQCVIARVDGGGPHGWPRHPALRIWLDILPVLCIQPARGEEVIEGGLLRAPLRRADGDPSVRRGDVLHGGPAAGRGRRAVCSLLTTEQIERSNAALHPPCAVIRQGRSCGGELPGACRIKRLRCQAPVHRRRQRKDFALPNCMSLHCGRGSRGRHQNWCGRPGAETHSRARPTGCRGQ